jgi:ABC-type multidrug transport system fused ATPase/permease subunit
MNKIFKLFKNSEIVVFAFNLLTARDRRKVFLFISLQILNTLLDLVGVGLIGILSLVAVSGINDAPLSPQIVWFLELINLADLPFENQCVRLGMFACVLLITRTILSVLFTKKIMFTLSSFSAKLSARMVRQFLNQSVSDIQSRSSQETVYSLTRGVDTLILQVLATFIILVTDLFLVIIIILSLFIVDPVTAITTLVVFGSVSVLLARTTHSRSLRLGSQAAEVNIDSNQRIVESINGFRELFVRDVIDFYSQLIQNSREKLAAANAQLTFIPYMGKYAFEMTLIIGSLIIFAYQFTFSDLSNAISTFTVFIAAGSRISPAILRTQQGFFQINMAAGLSQPTLKLLMELGPIEECIRIPNQLSLAHSDFNGEIHIDNLTFSYTNHKIAIINDLTMCINQGEFVAIVGPSGVGKSTLVDLILGLLEPIKGSITISGLSPRLAIKKWPGSIGYVAQNTQVISGTISENVSVGFLPDAQTEENVLAALIKSNAIGLVRELADGMQTKVGENGSQLSGGQKQRLGIARALYTNPRILFLDESTSSLDSKTESEVLDAIDKLLGNTTIVMIAHRLSTIKKADKVVYLAVDGRFIVGTFDEVRQLNPEFEKQASILGI